MSPRFRDGPPNPRTHALPVVFRQEARNCLENVGHVLNDALIDYSDIVSVQIYLDDMSNFREVNAIYEEHFKGTLPLEQACRSPSCFWVLTSKSRPSRTGEYCLLGSWIAFVCDSLCAQSFVPEIDRVDTLTTIQFTGLLGP
jgi:hypothetical protein